MNTQEKINLLKKRFVLRDDTYAIQRTTPEGDAKWARALEGFCNHRPKCTYGKCPDVISRPLTNRVLQKHLLGEETIGVYQLDLEGHVKWLCLDVDVSKGGELKNYEQALQEVTKTLARDVYKAFGKDSFLVESSGNRGYHVWLFFEDLIHVDYVYALGHWFVQNLPTREGVHVEVYPKQTGSYTYGNLVKLPLGLHRKTQNRCFFVGNDFKSKENQWEALEGVRTLSSETVLSFMKANTIEKNQPPPITEYEGEGRTALPCMSNLMAEGAKEGTRDAAIFRLAVYLKDRGLPSDVASVAIDVVNEKQGNPLDAQTVSSKIDSAYANKYSPFPCRDAALDSYCSSSCRFWEGKVIQRWRGDGKPEGKISRD